jgi:hypothetical protein
MTLVQFLLYLFSLSTSLVVRFASQARTSFAAAASKYLQSRTVTETAADVLKNESYVSVRTHAITGADEQRIKNLSDLFYKTKKETRSSDGFALVNVSSINISDEIRNIQKIGGAPLPETRYSETAALLENIRKNLAEVNSAQTPVDFGARMALYQKLAAEEQSLLEVLGRNCAIMSDPQYNSENRLCGFVQLCPTNLLY